MRTSRGAIFRAPIVLLAVLAALFSSCDLSTGPSAPAFPEITPSSVSDPEYPNQWALPMLSAREAWGITAHGEFQGSFQTAVVAVIDEMIDFEHRDLQANALAGDAWDFVLGKEMNPADETNEIHGTHVSGIIGAVTSNTGGDDIAGIGNNLVKILPIRALDRDGTNTVDRLMEAVHYAAGLPNSSGRTPSRSAQVINLSLGGQNGAYLGFELGQLLQDVEDLGITVVAAAGNAGSNQTDYPGKYAGVLAVGSLDGTGRLSSFSNYGDMLDLVAPGGTSDGSGEDDNKGILSLTYEIAPDFTVRLSGTSMATPYVSGVVALMYAYNPEITPSEVYRILIETSEDLGASGNDEFYAWGGVNAYRALKRSMMEPYGPYALDPRVVTTQLGPVNFMASSSSVVAGSPEQEDPESIVASEYILTINAEGANILGKAALQTELSEIAERVGADTVRWVGGNFWKVSYSQDRDPTEAVALLEGFGLIQRASPNRRVRISGDIGPHPVSYEVLHTGSQSGRDTPGTELVGSSTELDGSDWFSGLPNTVQTALDQVNLEERTIVALFAGERPTGGYAVELERVRARGNTLYMDYHVSEPAPGDLVTQALTSPYLILTVEGSFAELEIGEGSR